MAFHNFHVAKSMFYIVGSAAKATPIATRQVIRHTSVQSQLRNTAGAWVVLKSSVTVSV